MLTPDRLRDPGRRQAAIAALAPDLLVLADYGTDRAPGAARPAAPRRAQPPSRRSCPATAAPRPCPPRSLAGDAETGVSLMRMDAGIDTGPLDRVRSGSPLDGHGGRRPTWSARLAAMAARAPHRVAARVARRATLAGGPPARGRCHAHAPAAARGRTLDPSRPAPELERQVRAYQPWPGAWIEQPGGRLIVVGRPCRPGGPSAPQARAGDLVALGPDVALVTTDGSLVLDRVQPAGKRPMSGRDYRRGRRDL